MPEITIQRSQQPVQRRLEPILIGERDPVAVADLRRQLRIRHRLAQHRHDPLLHLPRILDLVLAIGRGHRRGRDHEQERVGLLDRALDRLREHLTVGDPLGVQPHLLAPRRDRLRQPAHKLGVPPRIRHEHVSHQDPDWRARSTASARSAAHGGARGKKPPRTSSPPRPAKAKAKPSRTRAHASSPDCKPKPTAPPANNEERGGRRGMSALPARQRQPRAAAARRAAPPRCLSRAVSTARFALAFAQHRAPVNLAAGESQDRNPRRRRVLLLRFGVTLLAPADDRTRGDPLVRRRLSGATHSSPTQSSATPPRRWRTVRPARRRLNFAAKATDRGARAATAADGPRACPASW